MRRTAENLCVFSVVLGVLFVCRVTGSEGLCADGICKNSSQLSGTQPDTPRNVQLLLPSSSAAPPISMSMLAEDHVHEHHMPDVEESSAVIPLKVDEPKARAINFTLSADSGSVNGLAPNATMAPKTAAGIVTPKKVLKDISDVNMDDDDDIYPMHLDTTEYPRYQTTNSFTSINQTGNREVCLHDGKKYMQGEKMQKACDETCVCGENGKLLCTPRCNTPFFRKGRQINDPLCTEKDVEDPCCALLVCAADTETEPLEICSYQNKTYHRGETFDEGCVNRCSCEHSGNVACKPRCPPVSTKTSDRCVDVPDPKDPCCIMVLCDVTLNDHDKDLVPTDLAIKILSAKPINETTVQLMVEAFSGNVSLSNIEISEDKQVWRSQEILPDNLISKLESGHKYYIKIGENSNMVEVVMPTSSNVSENVPLTDAVRDGKCSFKGLKYKIGEEFHDDCTAYCLCTESGVQCDKMDCPTNFGLDVLDPHCLEWETVPPNFVPRAPHCCAEKVQCKNNGSCMYEGNMYSNLEEISTNITGCHKRCYCELGKVECQEICPPVTAQPPPDLKCDPQHAKLTLLPDDECCLYWMCQTIPKDGLTTTGRDRPSDDAASLNKSSNGVFLLPTPIPPLSPAVPAIPKPTKLPSPFHPTSQPSKQKNSNVPGPIDLQYLEHNFNPSTHPGGANGKNKTQNKVVSAPDMNDVTDVNEEKVPFKYFGPLAPDYQENVPAKDTGDANRHAWPSNPKSKPPKISPPHEGGSNNKKYPKDDHYTPPHLIGPFPPQTPDYFNNAPSNKNKPSLTNSQANNQNHFPVDVPKRVKDPIHDNLSPEDILHLLHQQHPSLIHAAPGTVIKIINGDIENAQKNLANIPLNHPQFSSTGQQAYPGASAPVRVDHILQHINANHPYSPYPPHSYPGIPGGEQLFVPPSGSQHPLQAPHINISRTPGFVPDYSAAYPTPPTFNQPQEEINIVDLEALSEHVVRLVFAVPSVMVGLHGRVELRYTNQLANENPSTWESQVFAPPNDLIATPQLHFELPGLLPDTEYKIKITVLLRDLHNTPSSKIYHVRTQPAPSPPPTTLPPNIPIEPNLSVGEVNSSWVVVTWRKFTDYELQFIDGVQIRYKETNGMVYAATPLIHRAVTSYTIENLKPNSEYEIGIFFIPFPGQETELKAANMIRVWTPLKLDLYGFNVTLELTLIKSTSVELTWTGVPYPQDKYVNIYRAIYKSEFGKESLSRFKIAKRDAPAKTTVYDLKPSTVYRLWLEVYLTNGKIKTSNVKEFKTTEGVVPSLDLSAQQGKLAVSETKANQEGDYYGPLVVVSIVAAIAILGTLVLSSMLMKRHGQNKAAITTPSTTRVSQSSYDNPTYKVEIQQETMNL